MIFKRFIKFAPIFGLVVAVSSCKEEGPPRLEDYFEAKSAYGAVLDDWLSGENENWRVLPIYGPIYALGTPMVPGSTEPLTDKCKVPEGDIQDGDMSTFPAISANRKFSMGASVPSGIAKAKNLLASGGLGFSTSTESNLSYDDMRQIAVFTDVFDEAIFRTDCLMVIANKDVTLIRGQIIGKETISSNRTVGANATVEVLEEEALKLTFDREGGYKLQDTEALPKYYYVYNRRVSIDIPEDAPPSRRRALIEDFLRTESTSNIEVKDSKPTDDQIDSFVRQSRAQE